MRKVLYEGARARGLARATLHATVRPLPPVFGRIASSRRSF